MTEAMKDGDVADPVPGVRDIFTAILGSVTEGMTSMAKVPGLTGAALLEAVSEVATGTVRGAIAMGSDLVPGAKAIVIGIARSAGGTGDAALQVLSHAARVVVHQTADRGGNLAAASKGLVLGAIASARTLGVDTAKAASAAAQGALEGARESGSVTVERVLAALKEPIGGIKVVLPEPLAR